MSDAVEEDGKGFGVSPFRCEEMSEGEPGRQVLRVLRQRCAERGLVLGAGVVHAEFRGESVELGAQFSTDGHGFQQAGSFLRAVRRREGSRQP